MNCLEFRRMVLADPRRPGAEADAHAAACAGCRRFLARTLDEEARLDGALRVEVPEGLRSRILDRLATARGRSRWLALPASVVVAAGIALAIGWSRTDKLVFAGVDFVVFREAQSIIDAAPADWSVLAPVARDMGVPLPQALGEMRYVCVYPLAAGAAHHVLVKTPFGKVTLLLIPDHALASRAAGAAKGLSAAVVPAPKGTVIIVGNSARGVQQAEMLLKPA